MRACGLIFCERTGAWALALKQVLADCPLPQRQTRGLDECRQALAGWPGSLVLLELTPAGADDLLEFVAGLSDADPAARAVVLAPRDMQAWREVMCEAGALAFCASPRQLKGIAGLIQRFAGSRPPTELTTIEQIVARLPWKREENKYPRS